MLSTSTAVLRQPKMHFSFLLCPVLLILQASLPSWKKIHILIILPSFKAPEAIDACMLPKQYLVKTHSVPGTAADTGDALGTHWG